MRTSSERKKIAWERGWIICRRERLAGASNSTNLTRKDELREVYASRENKTIYSNGTQHGIESQLVGAEAYNPVWRQPSWLFHIRG